MKQLAAILCTILLVACTPSAPTDPNDGSSPEPPPEPEPPPTDFQLTPEEVLQFGIAAGIPCLSLDIPLAIAIAESSLRPGAENLHPEYGERSEGWTHRDRGLMQISSYWWPAYPDTQVYDPQGALEAAWEISEQGSRWDLWNTYENGVVDIHLDNPYRGWPAVRPLVTEFCNND